MTENKKRLDEAVKSLVEEYRKWAVNNNDRRSRDHVFRDALRPFFADPAPVDASEMAEVLRDFLRTFDHPMANYDPIRHALFGRTRMALAAWDGQKQPAATTPAPAPTPNADLVKMLHYAAASSCTLQQAKAFRALADHFAGVKP